MNNYNFEDITISATPTPTAPTTQATNVGFSSTSTSGTTIGWTRGNGDNCAVFMVATSSGTASPEDETSYSANTAFGSGDQIGSTGWYCVYNGSGTGVTVTGLTTGTTYQVHVCEYNEGAGSELYNTSSATDNPDNETTLQLATVTTNAAGSITSTGATLNGTINANSYSTAVTFDYGEDTGYGTSVAATPSPVTGSTNTSVSKAITGLSPGTEYHFRVVGVNSAGTSNGLDATFSTSNAVITFTNGSSFTPAVTVGSTDQAIGRFQLAADVAGATFTDAVIKLNGTRTGLSNLKLWQSTDATFGGDTQLGSTVAVDPGTGNSVTFSSFSSSITTGGLYYFLSGDVAGGASGAVQGVIASEGNLTLSKGTLSSTFTNAPLSNGEASLPVDLSSFSARCEGKSVIIEWTTESETNNLGFILERSLDENIWTTIASFQTHDELKGQGNTSSATEYTFTDSDLEEEATYSYRLSDVSTDGDINIYASLSITVNALPKATEMEKAYPNPFNPQTYITYHLSENVDVNIAVFDMLGRQVKTLYAGQQPAGSYHIYWNTSNTAGGKVPTGTYLIRMQAGNVQKIQKVMLIK